MTCFAILAISPAKQHTRKTGYLQLFKQANRFQAFLDVKGYLDIFLILSVVFPSNLVFVSKSLKMLLLRETLQSEELLVPIR